MLLFKVYGVMKASTSLLALMLLLGNCNNHPSPSKQGNGDKSGASYLALGDSYTIGESVPQEQRWPVLLADALNKSGKPVQSPYIIARSGWTTRDLLNAIQNYTPEKPYDMVSLLIGVNNQYRGRSLEEFRTEFHELLIKSIGYAGGEKENVFVLSIPDWGVTPYGTANRESIAKEINNFNSVAKEECKKEKILFIDITPISRTALNDPSMIASDNLHFSGKMYQLWVNEALGLVKSKI
ncbi:SGNH/GDSL hydrolase family protein [Dyadobacter arcticus]|uniref:Lysophospholipase L1-like esterase n=1 Tax=Dyadobacter arcticus TaxID=1078754 RepID=A0ABX0URC9_9BACT|nr:SGNH/GDSL hydrolase family protein [Dyadobacter arcticus]NIJ54285.1 lysophospholipase L1-like esterase [Dyadobacter arcticus]